MQSINKIIMASAILIGNKNEYVCFEQYANNIKFIIIDDDTKEPGDFLMNPIGNTTEIIIYNAKDYQVINNEKLGLSTSYSGRQLYLDFCARPVANERYVIEVCLSVIR